jgi:hypothetical protein
MADEELQGKSNSNEVESDETTETNGKPGNIAGPLYMAALVLMAMGLNYGLTFVWPGENKSLTYLPRFLTSIVLAFLLLHVLGVRQKS